MAVGFGGAGGIRTLDRALQPYNGLANRRLQPLGHSSVSADMPDARASRKRQIELSRGHLQARTLPPRAADVPYRVSGPGLELRRGFVVGAASNRVDLISCRAGRFDFACIGASDLSAASGGASQMT